jgi:Rrf2 family transcriptional regulator, iron-sulfur cluster assembly transcription factor
MKITAQEEYGLRVLLRIASCKDANGISIPQISEAEGLSSHYAAKLTRVLRMAGFINSTPGYKGGYVLAKPANEIKISELLKALGGSLFDEEFCGLHSGNLKLCTNSVECSSRSLWQMIQFTVDRLLNRVTLHDLLGTERESAETLSRMSEENAQL